MQKRMSLWFPLCDVAITGQHAPTAFGAKQLNPLFIFEASGTKLVFNVHDRVKITEKSTEPPTKSRRKVVIDEKLHAALRLPMLAS